MGSPLCLPDILWNFPCQHCHRSVTAINIGVVWNPEFNTVEPLPQTLERAISTCVLCVKVDATLQGPLLRLCTFIYHTMDASLLPESKV